MKHTNVLVIGGSAAGLVSALAAKSHYPNKDVMLIRKEEKAVIPCGIPYIFGTLNSSEEDILPDSGLEKAGIEISINEVITINGKEKKCQLKDYSEITFDKLILATGSTPKIPSWLKGTHLENVFTVPKDLDYLNEMNEKLKSFEKIVVIGAGFIGIEMSDELKKKGKDVTLIEVLPHILGKAFDADLADEAEKILLERGVKILKGHGVREIIGDTKVEEVKIEYDDIVDIVKADAVILAMGYKPNTELAKKLNIAFNRDGFIKVDEYMRTDIPDIFAVGDCAEKRDFFTRKRTNAMLASIACAEARVAGMNLFKLSTLKSISGTIAIFSTALNGTGFGAAGLTETVAQQEGFDVITGTFKGIDRHPGVLNSPHKQIVKLVAGRENGMILGGEVMGGSSTGELINIIGLIIQNKMNVNTLLTSQIGTHPMLTASPAAYPLIKAAEKVAEKFWNK
jgi:NADPH-dependent 2,4-dienoyl-CoA reductase/sulfur reductase-like enzyme